MFRLNKPITLVISAALYDEIVLAMAAAGAHVTFTEAGLDMRSIGLVRGEEPAKPVHRPISKNTAPGAI